jgi:hypothetical protein
VQHSMGVIRKEIKRRVPIPNGVPDCFRRLPATLTVTYRAEIARWKVEGESDCSRHLCPAHKRKDWHAVATAQFSDNLRRAHRTPG